MSGCNFSRRSFLLASLALAGGLLFATFGTAGKPGGGDGGSVPPGRIFFNWSSEIQQGTSSEDRGFWSMNADGKDKQLLYRPENAYDLSYTIHGGHRWFLAFGPSPSGAQRGALFAVRDDGDPDFVVLLLEAGDLPGDSYFYNTRWGKDDTFISFVAYDVLNDGSEIWAAEIDFDEVTGTPFLTTTPVSLVQEPQTPIGRFDFSPLADEVVYQVGNGSDPPADSLLIKDLITGNTRLLFVDGAGPVWSPDGTRIAFQAFGDGIRVIKPDGTGEIALTKSGSGPTDWSPDSKHITYPHVWWKNGPGSSIYYADVMRIPAAGGSAVNLTKDIDGFADPAYWR